MKKTLLLLLAFLLFTGMLSAQIVNIPNPAFKAKLLSSGVATDIAGNQIMIDVNNDGEIQITEALNVYSIRIQWISLPDMAGIGAFTNLKKLDTGGAQIGGLDVTGLSNLETVLLGAMGSTTLDFSNLPYLKRFEAIGPTQITSIDLSGLPQLEEIYIWSAQNLVSLNLSGTLNLKKLKLDGGNQIANLDISMMQDLEEFQCTAGQLSNLNIVSLPKLKKLNVKFNQLNTIDLSGCPQLNDINLSYNNLSYANIKNGINSIFFEANNNLGMSLCIDEGEEQIIAAAAENSNWMYSNYCTFTPGGNYNTISGTFTFDGDNNGCTSNDVVARNMRIGISDGTQMGTSITNVSGNYNFYTQTGNFTLTPQFENNWFTATPATAIVNFADNNNNTSTQNFCIAPNGVHPDVEVVLVPVIGAQPGFDSHYQIVFKNKGNQILNGNVTLNYDEAILDFVSLLSTAPTSATTGQLTWAYSNLLPFESRVINVTLNLNGPMETPPVNNDDVLTYSVNITPTTGDETPGDNTFTLNQVVTGSFDPNDITCLEGDIVHPDKIGEYLHYNINFENTGTAPATFIVVKDMINAQQYDINSLQMLHASHSVETRINGNKVEFFFDDINLGPLAKGNVTFKIKTKPTVAVNSAVMNKAEIFFDYNWPIVTNEAETTFALLSTGDFAIDNSVSVYPNPAITNVTIKASSTINSVQLYDIQGRLLMATKDATLDMSARASGMYFVKVMTDKGMKVEKLIRE